MKSEQFPKATLLQALKDTKKIKTNLKPLMAQFTEYNMPWLMQTISILFHNLTNQQTKPLLKMNSMFAIKCLAQSCQYAVIALIEAYIFPIIKRDAFVDHDQPEDQRGADFFQVGDGENQDQVINYGYNYVLLCTELVKVLAVIKPRNLFYDQQTEDLSDFEITNLQLKKQLKHPNNQLRFFKQKPSQFNTLFKKKLAQFQQKNLPIYQKYILTIFKQQLQSQFILKKDTLDIRKLIQQGDQFIYQNILQYIGTIISSDQPSCNIVCHALSFVTDMVRSGNYGLAFFMHNNDAVKIMVRQVIVTPNQGKDLSRGVNYLQRYKGTPEEHRKLYMEFLKNLEYWGKTYLAVALKSHSADEPSNLAKYIQILKKHEYEFPNNPQLDNLIRETNANLQRHKSKNKRLKQEVISQVQPEEDNSIMIMKSINQRKGNSIPSKGKIEQQSVKKQKQKQQISSKPILPTPSPAPLSKIKDSPQKTPKDKVKRIQRAIQLLTQNQKALPENMKSINTQTNQLSKYLEENDLQESVFEQLVGKLDQIDEKMQKIKPVYQQYKSNKIDYRKFCKMIAPVSSNGPQQLEDIDQVDEPASKIQQIGNQGSKNSISIKSQKDQIKQSKASAAPKKQQPPQSKPLIQSKKQQQSHSQSQSQSRASIPPHKQQIPSKPTIPSKKQQPSQSQSRSLIPQKKQEPLTNLLYEHGLKISSKQDLDNRQLIHSKVNFSESGLQQSKFTQNVPQKPHNHQENGVGVDFEVDSYEPVAFMTRSRAANQAAQNQFVSPIKQIHYQRPEPDQVQYIKYQTQKQQLKVERQSRFKSEYEQNQQQQQYIQNPSLVPLDNSFHDLQQIYQQSRKSKSFKQAISNQKLFIKTNKKQNMFKLSQECRSIVKPVVNMNKTSSRVSSKINVPELLNERSRKHEVQMKLLNQNKDKEIRDLMQKLKKMERENSQINQELKAKEVQIRSLKQNSQADPAKSRAVRSNADQFSLVDDQNFLLKKKFNAPNPAYNFKKTGENFKNQSRMLATGELIDSKPYQPYFNQIKDQKTKKMFMKNKQLLYKTNQIQIGSIGQLKNGVYTITIFITPQIDIILRKVEVKFDKNLEIRHDIQKGQRINAKKQLRKSFQISIQDYPHQIPLIKIHYTMEQDSHDEISFRLPCAFHKFFTIRSIDDQAQFNRQFDGNIIRGQEIPYSRKILKNIDLLQDFLPDIKKLSRGEPNQKGEICFGGMAYYDSYRFLVKISVKPNQFLYIQAIASEDHQLYRLICFYIATLNHFLTKNVDWN